jgi:CBS domain containing-hemolysin-like protein
MEAVLLSTPLSYLKTQAEMGNTSALGMIQLKEDIDKPLSAILSLNTIAHTVGAAGVGAQATIVFGEAYFGWVSAALTILILVFTEIIPKTLGANYTRELDGFSAAVIRIMIIITYPLVLVSAKLTGWLSVEKNKQTISREEISALTNIGTQEGIFAEKENLIIQNLIRIKSINLQAVMTPRVVVVLANEDMTLQEFLKNKDFLHFSRIPIFQKTKDNITGYIFRELVFENLAEDRFDLKLKDIRREILVFSEFTTVFEAWETMIARKEHIAMVTDEFGVMSGIVSLEDIIETLLGLEIVDEKDTIEDLHQYAIERWKARQKKYDYPRGDTPAE